MARIQVLPRKALQTTGMVKRRCAARAVEYAQMSTKQTPRAEMLKSRFAETILKARLEIEGANPNKPEKTTSPQISKAAGAAASRAKEQHVLQKRRGHEEIKAVRMALEKARHRDRQRRAARIALQKMEKPVEVYTSATSILKDLEILVGRPVWMGYPDAKQLEKLGLYMKDRYLVEDENEDEDEDSNMELEEGEIPS